MFRLRPPVANRFYHISRDHSRTPFGAVRSRSPIRDLLPLSAVCQTRILTESVSVPQAPIYVWLVRFSNFEYARKRLFTERYSGHDMFFRFHRKRVSKLPTVFLSTPLVRNTTENILPTVGGKQLRLNLA